MVFFFSFLFSFFPVDSRVRDPSVDLPRGLGEASIPKSMKVFQRHQQNILKGGRCHITPTTSL